MRLKTLFTGCLFWILLATLSLAISNVALAGNYLGEIKWSVTPDESSSSEILVTGITYVGDNYHSVQGYIEPSDGDGIIVCDGSAILRDTTIYMTLHYTHTHTDSQCKDAHTWRINIDTNTFTGRFWSLGGSHCRKNETKFTDYNEGTISLITK